MVWILVVILLLVLVWRVLMYCRRDHPHWPVLRRYRYAHRGYHNKPTVPENSMAAFRAAVERGWGAELDVHLMKDGNLAVIHDASLKRTAGVDVQIEDLTKEDLADYVLEDSQERIPLLEEVLELFEGETPLIIELKSERGNYAALAAAVAQRLDGYTGDYCIESFDPRAVAWFAKHRPGVCRGQLSMNYFRRGSNVPLYQRFALTNLLANIGSKPDFVAYCFEDRRNLSLRQCERIWQPARVAWTIRSRADMETAEREGRVVIFEQFDPED